MKYLFLICLLATLPVQAELQNLKLNSNSYDEAKAAAQFLRFDMKSTKAGLLTTSFTGFVKKAEVTFQESATAYTDIVMSFEGADMDTDVSGRNQKMWDKCLDVKNHPKVVVKVARIEKGQTPQRVLAVIHILGQDHTFTMNVVRSDDRSLGGEAVLSLKELKIPDPSIFIASVSDEIRVSFQFKKEK